MANEHVDARTAAEVEWAMEQEIREYSLLGAADIFISSRWETSRQGKAVMLGKYSSWHPVEFDLAPILLAHRNGGLKELVGLLVAELLLAGDT